MKQRDLSPETEPLGYLHSLETMGTLDGPGVRTIFFLQGCPLRCLYCHNPDSQPFSRNRVITVNEVVKTALRYRTYYGKNGGVTFSGGEPLGQPDFLARALEALKDVGISTCIDTSGVGSEEKLKHILPFVDTILLDIKAWDPALHQTLTGVPTEPVNRFIDVVRTLPFKGRIWIRHVMMPGVTDNEPSMDELVGRIEPLRPWIDRIDILPYHRMGVEKYQELGLDYVLEDMPAMNEDRALELENYARERFSPSAKSR